MSRKFLKATARRLFDHYGKNKDSVAWLLSLSELRKKLQSERYLDHCLGVLLHLDYFCDNAHFYLGVNRPGTIGTKDLRLMNPRGQLIRSDPTGGSVTKLSAIHTEKSESVTFDFPMNFHLSLTQGLFSCPKNECGNRVILQVAGPERNLVIDWYIQHVAGQYACKAESVGEITRSNSRIAFLELQEDQHAADVLRDLRKMKWSCLVVVSTSDLTALETDSFWVPNGVISVLKTPVKHWIVKGCKKYSLFESIR